ncbi:Disease resistance protein RPP13 [Vitis vinifera]|uniref:Disease resistance protein RPP13 n=1 Tax=Vitis vinifera TaxID=29760 RepID=A0A438H9J4_VITVI|nr:Disease resistance protein RPP13 [Vitis vinifera]
MSLSNEEKKEMREVELGGKLRECLNDKKYLVVMDDVWSIEAWSSLAPIFLSSVYELPIMDDDESWELFLKKTFGARDNTHVPSSKTLEELGRKIVAKCNGLPLAIVVLGGLLSTKERQNHHGRECLKSCFLYCGIFPEDSEIKASKLIHLWIAEGFVQRRGIEKLEDIAEDYLYELIHRSMVQVARKKANGRVMSCRIHDLLRDLAISEARDAKLFEELRHLNCCYGEMSSQFKLNKCMNGYLGVEQLTNLQTLALPVGSWLEGRLKEKDIIKSVGLKWQENVVEEKTLLPGLMSFSRHTFLYKVHLYGKVDKLPEQTEFYPPNLLKLTLSNMKKLEKLGLIRTSGKLMKRSSKQRERVG